MVWWLDVCEVISLIKISEIVVIVIRRFVKRNVSFEICLWGMILF